MSQIIERFENIKSLINNSNVKIVAVTKTFEYDLVKPLVEYGHCHFGENKVQEAQAKWGTTKKEYPNLNLHMIGKLQSNKAKEAVLLFDYIHSVDNPKLAGLLSKHETNAGKKLKYFIQVNIGNEKQKSGIALDQLDDFYNYCTNELKINIIGLMAIPPNDGQESMYFKNLMQLNKTLGLKELSMGMSGDFKEAIKFEATYVRIGSSIFGNRS
ncbi:YggS family pyridoxal phosphate-dependent enzyme [Pelagibacteraceae bacterium]|jgi:pyridoxal phosphate enzyme (YggS family)|nr:YggS family pyridoxal phosphate-dependent enzyme [Pelagibacteraceae bacterium]|tara:strand:- start:705 stop:1343 length:639 start_codon:yes stop_codon:yes gene_type:complete